MSKVEKFLKKWNKAKKLAKDEMLNDSVVYDLCTLVADLTEEEYEELMNELEKNLVRYYDDIETIDNWRYIAKENKI